MDLVFVFIENDNGFYNLFYDLEGERRGYGAPPVPPTPTQYKEIERRGYGCPHGPSPSAQYKK